MLHRNLGLKLAALGLAIFLWFWVLYTERNVLVSGSAKVAVAPSDLPAELALATSLGSVEVRVKGRHPDLDPALRQIEAYVSCKGLKPGDYMLPVRVVAPAQLTVARVTPGRIAVRLKAEQEPTVRTLPVVVRSRGTLPDGFRIVSLQVEPPVVTLRGPGTKVRVMSQVQTDQLPLDTLVSQPTQELSLVVPSGVKLLGPRSVTITAKLEQNLPLVPHP
jgi:YbbR domain-containing protein